MMIFHIHHFISSIEFRMAWKECIIQESDMYCRNDFFVVFTTVKIVIRTTQIEKRSVWPIQLVGNLHLCIFLQKLSREKRQILLRR